MNLQMDTPVARHFLERAQATQPELLSEVITLCQIPAPTFSEAERAVYVADRWRQIGLDDVTVDDAGNAVGRVRGAGRGPALLLAAHMDTVFPHGTDVNVKVEGELLRAPGVGDNSSGVAVMIRAAQLLLESGHRPAGDILFAATVGEEGLGNLRGIRAVVDRHETELDYVLAIDGSLGSMVRQGVGSRRFKLVVTTDGGHSWGGFGLPSAIHALGRMIARITDIRVPAQPKTTYNVGTISGGTSVNTIAPQAEAMLDLRSLNAVELGKLEERIRRIVTEVARECFVAAELVLVGDRPTGEIPEGHPLCRIVRAVHHQLGVPTRSYPSSTDANVPLSRGIPAVSVGVTLGGNAHRLDEYIHATPLSRGLSQVLLLLLAAESLPLRNR